MAEQEKTDCLYGGGCNEYLRGRAPCVNCHEPKKVGPIKDAKNG